MDHTNPVINPEAEDKNSYNFLSGIKFFGSFYRMAIILSAGLLIGYSIYYFGKKNSVQSIYSQSGGEKVGLPDKSIVTLNKGAEIIYPKSFAKENRLISIYGEGFFEIQNEAGHPFIIRSGNLSIRTDGCSLNVKTSPESGEIIISVKEGLAAIYEGSDRKNEKKIIARQMAVFNKETRQISISENENLNFMAWKTGKMEFENSPFSDVISILASVYHREFYFDSEDLKNCKLTAAFENQNLESVMSTIELNLKVKFIAAEGKYKITGTGCLLMNYKENSSVLISLANI